jgi:hypothetical protein
MSVLVIFLQLDVLDLVVARASTADRPRCDFTFVLFRDFIDTGDFYGSNVYNADVPIDPLW